MAFPRILFVTAFLLLLSFWVDLCHQSSDDDEDEGSSPQELLLEKTNKTQSDSSCHQRCCTFRSIHLGSRQKVVILVYVDLVAIVVLLLGGALACYGLILFLKMKQVRSEWASSEMRKVAGLAFVSVISFTSSALVAIVTNIPLFYHWHERQVDGCYTSLLLVLYYFIGSSVPSAFILVVMRELPQPIVMNRREEPATIAFITDGSVATSAQNPDGGFKRKPHMKMHMQTRLPMEEKMH